MNWETIVNNWQFIVGGVVVVIIFFLIITRKRKIKPVVAGEIRQAREKIRELDTILKEIEIFIGKLETKFGG